MAKGPLITRSQLRKHKIDGNKAQSEKLIQKSTNSLKVKSTTDSTLKHSRTKENSKTRERSHTLNIAIGVVLLLLLVLFYIVFHW